MIPSLHRHVARRSRVVPVGDVHLKTGRRRLTALVYAAFFLFTFICRNPTYAQQLSPLQAQVPEQPSAQTSPDNAEKGHSEDARSESKTIRTKNPDTGLPRRPTEPKAHQAFVDGVAAAQRKDFESAARHFQASFERQASRAALFAWAQAARLSGRCDAARRLYIQAMEAAKAATEREAIALAAGRCGETAPANQDAPQLITRPQLSSVTNTEDPSPTHHPNRHPALQRERRAGHSKATPQKWFRPILAAAAGAIATGSALTVWALVENGRGSDAATLGEFEQNRRRSRNLRNLGLTTALTGLLTGGAALWVHKLKTSETVIGLHVSGRFDL